MSAGLAAQGTPRFGVRLGGQPAAYTLVRRESCVDCGACTAVCVSGALRMEPESSRLVYSRAHCTGCGRCSKACPLGAISHGV